MDDELEDRVSPNVLLICFILVIVWPSFIICLMPFDWPFPVFFLIISQVLLIGVRSFNLHT